MFLLRNLATCLDYCCLREEKLELRQSLQACNFTCAQLYSVIPLGLEQTKEGIAIIDSEGMSFMTSCLYISILVIRFSEN